MAESIITPIRRLTALGVDEGLLAIYLNRLQDKLAPDDEKRFMPKVLEIAETRAAKVKKLGGDVDSSVQLFLRDVLMRWEAFAMTRALDALLYARDINDHETSLAHMGDDNYDPDARVVRPEESRQSPLACRLTLHKIKKHRAKELAAH